MNYRTAIHLMKRLFILLVGLMVGLTSYANLFSQQPKFLPSSQAFIFSTSQQYQQLKLEWQIAEGYYLYQKEIEIIPENASLAPVHFPAGERYHDEFFGDVTIFRNHLALEIPITTNQANGKVQVRYQGCTKGFCYPPESVEISLIQAVDSGKIFAKELQQPMPSESPTLPFSVWWLFVLGIGLAFTPCVLPMLPLLSAVVIGSRQRPNSWRALALSLSYVQGMAFTYTLLGLVVASLGLPFQQALQSPAVLIGLSILFVILSLSMFGLFEIRLPYALQQKLNQISQRQQGGSLLNVFVMGSIAGLVASPCTSAPLSSVLLYVAQTGDLWFGGIALYLLALGIGLPLVLITLFGNQILPKSGEWLLKVKTLFGFVMLALPIFLVARILPAHIEPLLWSALGLSVLIWFNEQFSASSWAKKALRLLCLSLIVFTAKPWLAWLESPSNISSNKLQSFIAVHSLAELNQQLTQHQGKKAMLDFYADWCVACKEFEKYTFSDPAVQKRFEQMLVLQIDMTENTADNKVLLDHFQILGLPTILLFDENGQEIRSARINGFLDTQAFLEHLNKP